MCKGKSNLTAKYHSYTQYTRYNPIMYRGWRNTAAFSKEFSVQHLQLAQKYIFAVYIFKTV